MINKKLFHTAYVEIFSKNGLSNFCTDDIIEKMYLMSDNLLEVNKTMNLTAITEFHDVIAKHLADSVIAAQYIPNGANVCDVGCGGGFPSLPLAIARPDISIVGIDSTEKRIKYVNDSSKMLGLQNVHAISGRAEDLSKTELRESFSACIARAVAGLPILCELCIPFVSQGGVFIAMKGRLNQDEITSAPVKLGAEQIAKRNIINYHLKTVPSEEERCIILLRKTAKTPLSYPRSYSQIKKKPLV